MCDASTPSKYTSYPDHSWANLPTFALRRASSHACLSSLWSIWNTSEHAVTCLCATSQCAMQQEACRQAFICQQRTHLRTALLWFCSQPDWQLFAVHIKLAIISIWFLNGRCLWHNTSGQGLAFAVARHVLRYKSVQSMWWGKAQHTFRFTSPWGEEASFSLKEELLVLTKHESSGWCMLCCRQLHYMRCVAVVSKLQYLLFSSTPVSVPIVMTSPSLRRWSSKSDRLMPCIPNICIAGMQMKSTAELTNCSARGICLLCNT